MLTTLQRIRGRLVEMEIGRAAGLGWVAVGIVREGLAPEVGLRFETKAPDPGSAEARLRAEIEAYFS